MIEMAYRLLAVVPKPVMLATAGFGHWVMEAKMLRGLKQRAESTVGPVDPRSRRPG
jgi:hypothetical protein